MICKEKRENRTIKNAPIKQEKSVKEEKLKNKHRTSVTNRKIVTHMIDINPTISITTLNINGSKTPIKIYRVEIKIKTKL